MQPYMLEALCRIQGGTYRCFMHVTLGELECIHILVYCMTQEEICCSLKVGGSGLKRRFDGTSTIILLHSQSLRA